MARVLARSLALGWILSAWAAVVGCSSINPGKIPFVTTNTEIEGQLAMARYAEQGNDFERAKKIYQDVIDKRPRNAMPYHRLAVIAAREEHPDVADAHFAKARELAPTDVELLADIGYQHYMQQRLPEAEAVLREAVERDPKHQRSLNNLGLAVGQQGRFDEALALFRRGGTDAESHANLAFVYNFHGNYELAKRHYAIALSKNPELKSAAEGLVELARVVPDPKPPMLTGPTGAFAGGPGLPPLGGGLQAANHAQPAAGAAMGPAAEQQVPFYQPLPDNAPTQTAAGTTTAYPTTSATPPVVEPGSLPSGDAQSIVPLPPITSG